MTARPTTDEAAVDVGAAPGLIGDEPPAAATTSMRIFMPLSQCPVSPQRK
jgi:hypothetical protein